jgi:serine/threonine protein kinase
MLSPAVEAGIEREMNLDDLEFIKVLGQGTRMGLLGSYGKVSLIAVKGTGRRFALKEINKASIKKNNMLKQVANEIKIMYTLDHPNIIKLYNHFEDDTSCYLLLEYADKVSHSSLISLGPTIR